MQNTVNLPSLLTHAAHCYKLEIKSVPNWGHVSLGSNCVVGRYLLCFRQKVHYMTFFCDSCQRHFFTSSLLLFASMVFYLSSVIEIHRGVKWLSIYIGGDIQVPSFIHQLNSFIWQVGILHFRYLLLLQEREYTWHFTILRIIHKEDGNIYFLPVRCFGYVVHTQSRRFKRIRASYCDVCIANSHSCFPSCYRARFCLLSDAPNSLWIWSKCSRN